MHPHRRSGYMTLNVWHHNISLCSLCCCYLTVAALSSMLAQSSVRPARLSCPTPSRVAFNSNVKVSLRPVVEQRALVVVDAQNSLRRQRVAERNRAYNKHYTELIKSSSRATMKSYETLKQKASSLEAESDLASADQLLHKAFSNIDKAVIKGVIHKNTGARRKSRLSRARQGVLIAANLYTPE